MLKNALPESQIFAISKQIKIITKVLVGRKLAKILAAIMAL